MYICTDLLIFYPLLERNHLQKTTETFDDSNDVDITGSCVISDLHVCKDNFVL